jgi:hypothetical protein
VIYLIDPKIRILLLSRYFQQTEGKAFPFFLRDSHWINYRVCSVSHSSLFGVALFGRSEAHQFQDPHRRVVDAGMPCPDTSEISGKSGCFPLVEQRGSGPGGIHQGGNRFRVRLPGGRAAPFDEKNAAYTYILAFRGLPLVLVISALTSLLFYWRIIPVVVNGFAWVLTRAMGIGGVEGLGAAANVFVGMVEAPLFVKPYLKRISRSELFTIMVCGMATIAGTVMVLYASILQSVVPGIMGHLLVASIVSAPAAITISKLMVPEVSTISEEALAAPRGARSAMDAITKGPSGASSS